MKSVSQILQQSHHLVHTLIERCTALQQIDRAFKAYLPLALRSHCRVVNVRDHRLIIWADNAPYATRLRYLSDEILQRGLTDPYLQGLRIQKLDIKVRSVNREVITPSPASLIKRRPHLSTETAMLLQNVAHSLKDQGLRTVLLRLARHTDKG
ncbi:hypothetical protein BegalDRAFT_2910 [Beggiatoa alba B18LD]|uniref:DUF721 domain-containing protein n=1 Tax=Beggiatoa alba B18LD TaxID=395493 RepID=I3CJE5_9GAMM|nr:DciA family protein [Beggiatoa alba]EIJ43738.1 hypothetical protein BegalDRAFT_2910 [Beggiatoa alba B18LD]